MKSKKYKDKTINLKTGLHPNELGSVSHWIGADDCKTIICEPANLSATYRNKVAKKMIGIVQDRIKSTDKLS
ncbi:hypothetical protein [Pedobacter nutrimenti]|nr:hypothetical protein [Pedobacter nutrimenti]